jgi:hypothetical protein
LKHEGEITAGSITKTLDKILGGDAKFKPVKENTLPGFKSVYESYL